MFDRGPILLCLSVVVILVQQYECQLPVDPNIKARLEARVMQSMSLKELEEMVEKDERVLSAPKSKLIIIPRGPRDDPNQEAYIIQRKPKTNAEIARKEEYKFDNKDYDNEEDSYSSFDKKFRLPLLRRSYMPEYRFESAFKFDEEFPSLFGMPDLHSEGSSPVKNFYESIIEKVVNQRTASKDPISRVDKSATEDIPFYRPRFNYDSYSKDPTEVKLKGKKYWRDAPERRGETVDDKGCRTVVKKIIDPEDQKKYHGANAKSVVITKECESPNMDVPDAKIPQIEPVMYANNREFDSQPSTSFNNEQSFYENSRPVELDLPSAKSRDPLAPDYIDKMLDSHFKSFPSFKNPITSFSGYQDRFKLQIPSGFKDIKPTVNVESYDRSHPQSGFEAESPSSYEADESNKEPPRPYKHSYRYEYPERSSGKSAVEGKAPPKIYEHHHHYDYPEKSSSDDQARDYEVKKEFPAEDKYSNKKDPKTMKKSFAYYRKDNPKEDPNDQQYAEEYAQGNYRSFSSDYDSERDGPKKA